MWNNPVVTGRCREILPVLVQNNRNIVGKLVFLGDTAAPVLMERSRINHSDPQTAVTYMCVFGCSSISGLLSSRCEDVI